MCSEPCLGSDQGPDSRSKISISRHGSSAASMLLCSSFLSTLFTATLTFGLSRRVLRWTTLKVPDPICSPSLYTLRISAPEFLFRHPLSEPKALPAAISTVKTQRAAVRRPNVIFLELTCAPYCLLRIYSTTILRVPVHTIFVYRTLYSRVVYTTRYHSLSQIKMSNTNTKQANDAVLYE